MSVRVSNISAMRALPTTAFSTDVANTVFVETVGDFFRFARGSSLTPASNYVVASSDGLGQWFRMGIPNPTFLAASYWAIDPAGGNDENAGYGATQAAADLVPLKTMAELNRRLVGASYSGTVVFHQLGSISDASWTPLTNVRTSNGNGYPVWKGTKTTLFSGAVTTYAAAVPGSNTGVQVSMSSLPVSWTASGLTGKLIENSAGTKTAWVQKDLGTKTARLTQPCSLDVTSYTVATSSSFSASEAVTVASLTDLPAYPFGTECGYSGVEYVNIASSLTEGNSGSAAVFYGRCGLATGGMRGASSGGGIYLGGCCISAAAMTLSGGSWACGFSGLRGSQVALNGAAMSALHSTLDMQASSILVLSAGYFDAFGTDSLIASFDATAAVLSVQDAANPGRPIRMNTSAKLYGSGNSTFVLSIPAGTSVTFPSAANCTITNTGSPLSVAGTSKNFADMPYADTTKLAGVDNG